VKHFLARSLFFILGICSAANSLAGGSGLNVVVVVNQNSSNSVQLGNYYCEQRNIPPQNFLRINWPGTNTEWALSDYTNVLLNPLLAMLAGRQLTNQIDYVVLSMDIPYRVNAGTNGENSTTSTLFYGFMADTRSVNTCPLAPGSSNRYAGSESIFRLTPPISGASNYFLVTMITSTSLALAENVINQGVLSDGTFPTQPVVLSKSIQPGYNSRYVEFDNAIFNARLRGNYAIQRTNGTDPPTGPLLGSQTGAYGFNVDPNNFVPGAMADNLNSFGGMLFEDTSGETTLLSYLTAGATGSFGTVIEPCSYTQKFPDSQNYFYQARGFSLAECYYQSVTNPYQGLVVGEPLAAPFALTATGDWNGLANNAVLSGTTNLSLQFTAADARHPLRQVDLFLDGTWLTTVTNISPLPGDTLNVTLNGFSTNYVVPTNASLKSITTGLTGVLNGGAFSALSRVQAYAHGDRIELHSLNTNLVGAQVTVGAGSANSSNPPTTFVSAIQTNFLDSTSSGLLSYDIIGTPDTNGTLQLVVTKTNNAVVTLTVTNTNGLVLAPLVQQLYDLINNTPALQGSDGLDAEDSNAPAGNEFVFNLRALNGGFAAAQITASLTASSGMSVSPLGAKTLTGNLSNLQPRNHLYLSIGVTNLALNFPLVTTNLSDGYHELAAVVYEGSHVHTETRATRNIRVQNHSLSATLTALVGGTNTAIEATLQFGVTANATNIAKIELYSTGGLLAAVSNQFSAGFSIPATNLDLGLHPFYAVVTDLNGTQYRTATQWLRFVGLGSPFPLQINAPPAMLVWPASAGRSYDILSALNAGDSFQLRASVVPTNSLGQWTETNANPAQQFYRVRVTP
jgi:uncharacterized protein (TIGR03790 family)